MTGRIRHAAAGLGVVLLLIGCSTDPTGTTSNQILGDIVQAVTPGTSGDTPDISDVTRARIAGITVPYMLFEVPDAPNSFATGQIAAFNGDSTTWALGGRSSVTFVGPVVFATRGFGPDLMSADVRDTAALVMGARGGTVSRTYRHLDGFGQTALRTARCIVAPQGAETITVLDVAHRTRRTSETCTFEDGETVANDYWVGADGTLWKSRQWIGEITGMMITQRLVK